MQEGLFPQYDPVRPDYFVATSFRPDFPASAANDLDETTFWVSGKKPGWGQRLEVQFHPNAVNIAKIGIFAGDPVGQMLVPKRLVLSFYRWVNPSTTGWVPTDNPFNPRAGWAFAGQKQLTLRNEPGLQRFDADAQNVGRVVLTILDTYRGQNPKAAAAITELEFFAKG